MTNSQKMTLDEAKKILGISTYDVKDAENAYSALNIKLSKKIRTPGTLGPERTKISQELKLIQQALKVIKDHANTASQTPPPVPSNPNTGAGSAAKTSATANYQNFRPPPPTPYTAQNTASRDLAYYLSLFNSALQNIFGFFKWLSPWVVRGIVLFAKGLAFIPWQMVNGIVDKKYYKLATYALVLLIIVAALAHVIANIHSPSLTAELRVVTVPWCYIFVNDKKLGLSGRAKPYRLLSGKHKFRLVTDDGKSLSKIIELPGGTTTFVKANLDTKKIIIERN